jgi:cytochrome c5
VRKFSATLLLACVCACSRSAIGSSTPEIVEPDARHIALAESLVPSDTVIAAIYDRSCRACHALNGLGAPLTGHSAAWAPRYRPARHGWIDHVNSFGTRYAMPSMGYCPDCTDDDFRALIKFMATEGQS